MLAALVCQPVVTVETNEGGDYLFQRRRYVPEKKRRPDEEVVVLLAAFVMQPPWRKQ
jgi:hypothetical protein